MNRRTMMSAAKKVVENWVQVVVPIARTYYIRNGNGNITFLGNDTKINMYATSKGWSLYFFSAPKTYKFGDVKGKKVRGSVKVSDSSIVGGELYCGLGTAGGTGAGPDRVAYGFPFPMIYNDGTYTFEGTFDSSIFTTGTAYDHHYIMFICYLYANAGSEVNVSDVVIEVDMNS